MSGSPRTSVTAALPGSQSAGGAKSRRCAEGHELRVHAGFMGCQSRSQAAWAAEGANGNHRQLCARAGGGGGGGARAFMMGHQGEPA